MTQNQNQCKDVVVETSLKSLRPIQRGKVRDIYNLEDRLLIIATDGISACDVVLSNGILQKRRVSPPFPLFLWFGPTQDVIANHALLPETISRLSKEVVACRL